MHDDFFSDLASTVFPNAETVNLDFAVRESHTGGNACGAGDEIGVIGGIRDGEADRNIHRCGSQHRTKGVPHQNNRVDEFSFGDFYLPILESNGVDVRRIVKGDNMSSRCSNFPSLGEGSVVFPQHEGDAFAGLGSEIGNRPNRQGCGARLGKRQDAVGVTRALDNVIGRLRTAAVPSVYAHARLRARGKRTVDVDGNGCRGAGLGRD